VSCMDNLSLYDGTCDERELGAATHPSRSVTRELRLWEQTMRTTRLHYFSMHFLVDRGQETRRLLGHLLYTSEKARSPETDIASRRD